VRSFEEIEKPRDGLRYTMPKVYMEKCQRSAWTIADDGELTGHQMAKRERVVAMPATLSSTTGNKRTDFVHPDFNAAFKTGRCAVLKMRPVEPTQSNFVGNPLILELDKAKLKPIADRTSKRLEGVCACAYIYILSGRETFIVPLNIRRKNE